jgi:signal peptide peptidase SppA
MLHVADRIFGTPLMIHQNKLRVVLEEVGGRIDPLNYQSAIEALPVEANNSPLSPLSAIALREQSDRKSYAVTASGIALIPVEGMLMKKSTWMSSWSGMCTYESITEQFQAAVDDPTVKGILFDIDSPGGETHGAFELSDLIYNARSASKPIYASADDLAASAAYAIASACDRIFVTVTGAVGSVGVYSMHVSQKEADKKMGLAYTYISAGERKVDGNPHEALSDTAYAQAKAEVDRQYNLFVSAVARNRGAKASDIVGTKALCYFAENAVPLLADEVGTLEDAVAALEAKLGSTPAVSTTRSVTNAALSASHAGTPVESNTSLKENNTMPNPATAATGLTEDEQKALAASRAETKRLKALAASRATAAVPATAAASPSTDDDEDDDDDDDSTQPQAAAAAPALVPAAPAAASAQPPIQGKKDKRPAAVVIAELCQIAGRTDAGTLIMEHAAGKITLDGVRAKLLADRAAASTEHMTYNGHPGSGTSAGSPLDRIDQMATTLAQNSGGKLSKVEAYERVLVTNPAIYEDYMEEQTRAATSGPRGKREYMHQMAPRFAAMGLGAGVR